MKLLIDKQDGKFITNIVQPDGTTITFNYIAFLKELYSTKGLFETTYTREIDENERKVMDDLFRRISEVFSDNDNPEEEEEEIF